MLLRHADVAYAATAIVLLFAFEQKDVLISTLTDAVLLRIECRIQKHPRNSHSYNTSKHQYCQVHILQNTQHVLVHR